MSLQTLAALGLATLASAMTHVKNTHTVDRRSTAEYNGVNYDVFEHAATRSTMSYVTNSGICETTAGVNQYSGYFSVGKLLAFFHGHGYLLTESQQLAQTCGSGSLRPGQLPPLLLWPCGSTAARDAVL